MRKPKYVPEYDAGFRPCAVEIDDYLSRAAESGKTADLVISIERNDNCVSVYRTHIFAEDHEEENCFIIERMVKTLLWIKGGWKITVGGPGYIGRYIADAYSPGGIRDFDRNVMEKIYERRFAVETVQSCQIRENMESVQRVGRHLNGCRIGFDAGGSDRKVSAVIDGEPVYSEEVIWHPKVNPDPSYHYNGILESFRTAASKMPRVDAIGVSAAGVYINNKAMIASLFMAVPDDVYEEKVRNIFIEAAKEIGDVPLSVANDGDVTALAGAMELNEGRVLGIAMGTSQAGGYVDINGNITGWLNELAFVPVDLNIDSMIDEWSGDYGCGVKYFSQDGVIKLAEKAGIVFKEGDTPARKLKNVQELHEKGNEAAKKIFASIGIYLGYSLAWYSRFYDIKHLLILGRVTSGKGGEHIIEYAEKVLRDEFPDLFRNCSIHMPDEAGRRVGQSIAAASLPDVIRHL